MAFLEEPRPNSPIDSEMEDNPTNNIRPYQFEPEWPADEHEEAHQFEDNEEQEFLYIDDESRRDNLEWWVVKCYIILDHCFYLKSTFSVFEVDHVHTHIIL